MYQPLAYGCELEVPVGSWNILARFYTEWKISSGTLLDASVGLSESSTSTTTGATANRMRRYTNTSVIDHTQNEFVIAVDLSSPTKYYGVGTNIANGSEMDLRASSYIKARCAYL